MSVVSAQSFANGPSLYRTAGLVPGSSDYTAIWQMKPVTTPSGGAYRTALILVNGAGVYTEYVWFGSSVDSNDFYAAADVGGGAVSSTPVAVTAGLWANVWYVRTGTTHRFYINGTLVHTITLDVSAASFTELWMGTDGYADGDTETRFARFREWSRALTTTELALESLANGAVSSTNLNADTPLSSNLLDIGPNGYDWTAVVADGATFPPPSGTATFGIQPEMNTVIANAIPLTVPSTVTQNVLENTAGIVGPDWRVWYRYTPQPADDFLLMFATTQTLGTYAPNVNVEVGPNATTTRPPSYNLASATQSPATIPLVENPYASLSPPVGSGNTFYFDIKSNGGTAPDRDLVIDVRFDAPQLTARAIFMPNDEPAFPGALMSATVSGQVLGIRTFPAGELGVSILTPTSPAYGMMLMQNSANPGPYADRNSLELYAKDFSFVMRFDPGGVTGGVVGVTSDHDRTFFYAVRAIGGVDTFIGSVDYQGNVGARTWTLPGVFGAFLGFAVALDQSVAYYGYGFAIKRWDLVNDVALTDLVSFPAGYTGTTDMHVLADGSLLVAWSKASDSFARRYDATTGATIQDYSFGSTPPLVERIALSDDPNYFLAYLNHGFGAVEGSSDFIFVRLADGFFGSTLRFGQFNGGVFHASFGPQAIASAPPRTGPSFSCPVFIVTPNPTPTPPPNPPPPPQPCYCPPAPCGCGPGGGPGGGGGPTGSPGPILPPTTPAWLATCIGGGDVPSVADLSDSENWDM